MPDHLTAALLPVGTLLLLFLSPWSRPSLARGGGNTGTEDMGTEDLCTGTAGCTVTKCHTLNVCHVL